nr:histidine phosphatase family protein [Kineosporia babensis]
MTLHLVRHASTAHTGSVPSGGDRHGPALSEQGVAEAEALARVLGPADALLTSPLLRTWQTAWALRAAVGCEPVADPELAELRLGEWDGLSYREIAERWPKEYAQWRHSPSARPPGGESVQDLAERTDACWRRLRSSYPGKSVVVVTHTGLIRAAVASALDAGPAAFWRLRIDPTGITTVRMWADGGIEVAGVNRSTPA